MFASPVEAFTFAKRSESPFASRFCSSSTTWSKWFSIASLPRPVTMRTSVRPAATASSTTYWIAGVSTTGSISWGTSFVAGRTRVPRPATGMTTLRILLIRPGYPARPGRVLRLAKPGPHRAARVAGRAAVGQSWRYVDSPRVGRHRRRCRDRRCQVAHPYGDPRSPAGARRPGARRGRHGDRRPCGLAARLARPGRDGRGLRGPPLRTGHRTAVDAPARGERAGAVADARPRPEPRLGDLPPRRHPQRAGPRTPARAVRAGTRRDGDQPGRPRPRPRALGRRSGG